MEILILMGVVFAWDRHGECCACVRFEMEFLYRDNHVCVGDCARKKNIVDGGRAAAHLVLLRSVSVHEFLRFHHECMGDHVHNWSFCAACRFTIFEVPSQMYERSR